VTGVLGDDILRRRVVRRCGRTADVFGAYGYKFGRWLDARPDAPPDRELAEVHDAITDYLSGAVREGRRWGTLTGLAIGLVGAPLAFVLIRVLS
jgi:hypothetical protein